MRLTWCRRDVSVFLEIEMSIYVNTRSELSSGITTLPAKYYTDPGHFEAEMEHIHFEMWLCAGRTEQIPDAGSYFVRRVGNASVIILRDADGKVHAHHNVCRHRGTMLCGDTEGRFAGRIQCQYHAWTYGLDGALVNAPHMDKVEGFREADYPLRKVAVDTWDGHVYGEWSRSRISPSSPSRTCCGKDAAACGWPWLRSGGRARA